MPTTPRTTNAAAAKHAHAVEWTFCHFCGRYGPCERWFKSWRCSDCSAENMPPPRMSDERRYYETIRREANRAEKRLARTLAQSRIASARDKRAKERDATIKPSGRPGVK